MCDLKTKALILTLMVTLFLCGTALAQSADPPPQEPLRLTDDQGEYPLGLHLEILEDPSGELTIDRRLFPGIRLAIYTQPGGSAEYRIHGERNLGAI